MLKWLCSALEQSQFTLCARLAVAALHFTDS